MRTDPLIALLLTHSAHRPGFRVGQNLGNFDSRARGQGSRDLFAFIREPNSQSKIP